MSTFDHASPLLRDKLHAVQVRIHAACLASGRPAGSVQLLAVSKTFSADDVRQMLDRLCEYYQRNEPSSPVPLLLRRARRLVGLGFADLMRDLSPDAIPQIEKISGTLETL